VTVGTTFSECNEKESTISLFLECVVNSDVPIAITMMCSVRTASPPESADLPRAKALLTTELWGRGGISWQRRVVLQGCCFIGRGACVGAWRNPTTMLLHLLEAADTSGRARPLHP